MAPRIMIAEQELREFCQRWKIAELSLFGSVLRDDFGPDSDVDVLVTYRPDAEWDLWDHIEAERELAQLFGRSVDLLTRNAVENSPNWIRRKAILGAAETLYVE